MQEEVDIFKPGIAELESKAEQYRTLTIQGVDDKDGYALVYDALRDLSKTRNEITKFGKAKREEALAFQREVLRQEKELLGIIVPIEEKLKSQREAIDEAKKRAERMILLPSRKAMLVEIEKELTDEEILDFDEKTFATMLQSSKIEYLERKDRERREADERKAREAQIEKDKADAVARAVKDAEAKAEREKQEAINAINREAQEKERKRLADEAQKKADAEQAERDAEAERKKAEKNKQYQEWVATLPAGVKIERDGETIYRLAKSRGNNHQISTAIKKQHELRKRHSRCI